LGKADYDKAMEMKTDLLENDEVPKEELDAIKINTNSLYKKGFSFPEVARNDFATDLFE